MATKVVSIVTGGNNNATVTAAEINALATDFIASGVVGSISLNTGSGGTGSFAVNAQGSPNMTVRVTGGQAYVSGTPSGGASQKVRVSMDTTEDVTIAANSSGSTRYDWIYISLDAAKLANPGANKDDVATLVASRSTSSATDNGTPPTYGYCLAVVTVANGASSITNSNITDSRVQTGPNTVSGQLSLQPNTTFTSGGASTAGLKLSSTANFGVFFGSGAPTFSAAKGSLYLRSDGSTTTTRAYVNTDGATTWTYLTAGA